MTEKQILDLGPALADFLEQFLFCCGYTQTFEHLKVYCRGLLSDLRRKSVEPIALAAGMPVRTLQEFLRDHQWHQDKVCQLLQQHVAQQLPTLPDDGLGNIGIVDETATPKKGRHTPGVQHQHCGHLGKQANCVVTVHLAVCRGRYKTILDEDLFLPASWSNDRPRCRAAGIPDGVVHRQKWRLALEEIDRALANGIVFDGLTFDEEYGKAPGFLQGLEQRQVLFVGEVPKTYSCLPAPRGSRRPPTKVAGQPAHAVVQKQAAFRKQKWQRVRLPRQTLTPQVWEVKATQVWAVQDRQWSTRTYWLLWARNVATGEEKYFVSNAAPTRSVRTLLRVAFQRWHVEHGFRVGKSELGWSHYEGRHYVGFRRHLVLCLLMMTFVADHTERLRKKKPGGDAGASVRRFAGVERAVAGAAAGDGSLAGDAGSGCLSPAAQWRRPRVTLSPQAAPCRPRPVAA